MVELLGMREIHDNSCFPSFAGALLSKGNRRYQARPRPTRAVIVVARPCKREILQERHASSRAAFSNLSSDTRETTSPRFGPNSNRFVKGSAKAKASAGVYANDTGANGKTTTQPCGIAPGGLEPPSSILRSGNLPLAQSTSSCVCGFYARISGWVQAVQHWVAVGIMAFRTWVCGQRRV
jgi:hypothetical protein